MSHNIYQDKIDAYHSAKLRGSQTWIVLGHDSVDTRPRSECYYETAHHLTSSLIFFTVSTARPTGASFYGWTIVTTNWLSVCLKL